MRKRTKKGFAAGLALLCLANTHASGDTETGTPDAATQTRITPGDARFSLLEFDDFQAAYSSSFSPTGAFTLQARKSGDNKTLVLVDIIPMADSVIVSQRHVDLATHAVKFGAGPYFAWGPEFVVSRSGPQGSAWTRMPIKGGDTKVALGAGNGTGYVTDMFSPTLAALLPMPVGATFQLPAAYPRADQTVSIEWDNYTIVRQENLSTASGIECKCWLVEKRGWDKSVEHIWVARTAPFVFRRDRHVGTPKEFKSELVAFDRLEQ